MTTMLRPIVPCPNCDTDLGNLSDFQQDYHKKNCHGRWVQLKDGQWGVRGALRKPDYAYCSGCGNWHTGLKDSDCKQPFEDTRLYA